MKRTALSIAVDTAIKRGAPRPYHPSPQFRGGPAPYWRSMGEARTVTIQKGAAMGATAGLLDSVQRFALQKASLSPALFSDYSFGGWDRAHILEVAWGPWV